MKRKAIALAAGCCVLLSGCQGLELLPYARELEGMALMRTLGVDAAENGVAVTASSAAGDSGEEQAQVTERTAPSLSAAVLGMQAEGASYVYFGHVGQMLLGEDLARRSAGEALDYVLRDVEMRLDTELYVVRDGGAGEAIRGAAEEGSAAGRLEAMAEDPGLTARSMPRTVREVLAELERCGASFAPALRAEEGGGFSAAGYAILKDGALAGWAEEEAAYGVNLLLGQVDADVVELPVPGGGSAALRVVGAKTRVRPQFQGGDLTGLEVLCRVDANLAGGSVDLEDRAVREALEEALARRESERVRAALTLGQELEADFLDLRSAAGLSAPWRWGQLREQWEKWPELNWTVEVRAQIRRSYDARA